MIKQVSFDVWNTLITPNAEYAKLRTQALADLVGVDFDTAKKAYTATKKQVDGDAEQYGIGLRTDAVFDLLLQKFEADPTKRRYLCMDFRTEVEALFAAQPPRVTDSAKHTIQRLKSMGIKVNIASNSNFISGLTMHPFLQSELVHLDYGVYSDMIMSSKPAPRFFMYVLHNEKRGTALARNILHVGDNMICDVEGAKRCGMQAAVVNDPDYLYDVVFTAIEEHTNA